MSQREALHEVVDRIPDEYLSVAMHLLATVEVSAEESNATMVQDEAKVVLFQLDDHRSIEERLAALNAWAGHLNVAPLPDEAYDRESMYRDLL